VGLFLDHRNTRQMVRQESAGKRVLNLFAYTGSFSVYAAAGGAAETLTIDMSNTYLQWADRNLSVNGFSGPQHRLLQADVLAWLEQPPREQFDLIVLDPPTFSNSKRMDDTLDIQRDHVMLLNRALRFCSPGGTLYFSTNYRRFKLWEEEIRATSITDISAKTVPEDFRNKKIHQCFRITK
jgi:23S rRNA (cytosine1962-C5)-methyltransferase